MLGAHELALGLRVEDTEGHGAERPGVAALRGTRDVQVAVGLQVRVGVAGPCVAEVERRWNERAGKEELPAVEAGAALVILARRDVRDVRGLEAAVLARDEETPNRAALGVADLGVEASRIDTSPA